MKPEWLIGETDGGSRKWVKANAWAVVAIIATLLGLLWLTGCKPDCPGLRQVADQVCRDQPGSSACAAARLAVETQCPAPPVTTTTTQPQQPPTSTTTTTVPPTTTTTTQPAQPQTACPKKFEGHTIYMRNKVYGQGLDSTVRVAGDLKFCQLIHGVIGADGVTPVGDDCHLEGWPKRVECEMELIGGCPEWEWSNGAGPQPCLQPDHPIASCDHYGNTATRDDPKTPEFEGEPKACGLQRDGQGFPKAGFFIIANGNADFRACKPNHDPETCGPWVHVDH